MVNQVSKVALSGVTATLTGGQTTTTDANGAFTCAPPPVNGTYTVTFSKTGYADTVVNGVVVSDTKGAVLNVGMITPGNMNIASPTPLLYGETGKPFDLRLPISGGKAPFSLSMVYGTLPPGVLLGAAGIGGTPTTAGTNTFAIGVTDGTGGYAEQEYTMAVTVPLNFSTGSILPRGIKGSAYTKAIIAAGGSAPYTFALLYGTLPNGLLLNSSTGVISGTLDVNAMGAGFTIKTTDAVGRTATNNFSLPVDAPLAITTNRLNDAIVGIKYNQTLAASGGYGAYTWNVFSGVLPAGLNLDSVTGVISGTASGATTQPLVLSVTDNAGRVAYKQFVLNALNPLQILTAAMPNAHVGDPYSELIRTSGGIGPYTFSYTGLLPAGLLLNDKTGVISGTPSSASFVNLGQTVTDSSYPTPQSLTRNLSIRTTSLITITSSAILPTARNSEAMNPVTLAARGGTSPYSWSLISGALPDGITINPTTGTLSGTPLEMGDFIFTIRVSDSVGNATGGSSINPDKQFFLHVSGPLAITTTAVPAGGKGIPYTVALAATGGQQPYTWGIVTGTLPTGLALDSATGIISGTPAAKLTSTVTFSVADGDTPAQSAQTAISFSVTDTLTIQETTLPQARVQQGYNSSIHAWLGVTPYVWRVSAGSLPPGVVLLQDAGIARLQGTPTAAGTYIFTIEAADSGTPQQTATQQFTLTVLPVFTITPSGLMTAVRTKVYSDSVTATGGATPYRFAIVAGSLPVGLTINFTTGVISGSTTDPAGQSSSFTVRVTDGGSPSTYLDTQLSIFVIDPLVITTASLPVATQKTSYQTMLAGSGGVAPLNWSLPMGVGLPQGLFLDTKSGSLYGTPVTCGSFPLSVQLCDSAPTPTITVKDLILNVTCVNDYAIYGYIDTRGVGATIALTGAASATMVTGPMGEYQFQHLVNGNYTITPQLGQKIFQPASRQITINNQDVSGADFTVATADLTVTISGTGGGSVNSNPQGISMTSGTVTATFDAGPTVVLTELPNILSTFGSWSDACIGNAATCSVPLPGNRAVTATFTRAPNAKIGAIGYTTLNAAYLAAKGATTIQTLDTELVENLNLSRGINIILKGGYKADYTGLSGNPTVLKGTLTIGTGSLIVDGLAVR